MNRTMRLSLAVLLGIAGVAGALTVVPARQSLSPEDAACLGNLKQVSTALLMYTQDYDEKLPPMQSMATASDRLIPYVKDKATFTCPATHKAYKCNAALSGRVLKVFAAPAQAVTFYDALPHASGAYSVAYLDGHVKREPKVPSLAPKLVAKKGSAASGKPSHHR